MDNLHLHNKSSKHRRGKAVSTMLLAKRKNDAGKPMFNFITIPICLEFRSVLYHYQHCTQI